MSFTTVTVTRDYDLADGTDPDGTVTFTPTAPMVNGVTVVAAPVVGKLDIDGILTIDLAANDDTGTLPTGVSYRVDELIAGAKRSYYVVIPYTSAPTLDLSTLDTMGSITLPDSATLAALLAAKQPLSTMLTRIAAAPVTVSYAASVTLNASLGCVHRVTATGGLTLADISNGVDGQQLLLEVLASGADRSVTVAGDTTTVPSGTWWCGRFVYHSTGDSWVLC